MFNVRCWTFAPSPDGEKLFIQATRAFLIVDVDSGTIEFTRLLPSNHTCSNHMIASTDTEW